MKRSKSIGILIAPILATYVIKCEAFIHHAASITNKYNKYQAVVLPKMVASRDLDEEQKTRNVVVISKSDDYVKFLEEDNQLCVIK